MGIKTSTGYFAAACICIKLIRVLTPTEDAFYLYSLQALYRFGLFCRAHMSSLQLPSPLQYGRHVVENRLLPIMMTKPPKPPSVKTISCKCKSSKCLRNCACAKSSVPCFIGCVCLGSRPKCGRLDMIDSDDDVDE